MKPFIAAIITIVLIVLCTLVAPVKKESEALKKIHTDKIHTDKYTVFKSHHINPQKDY